MQIDEKDFVQYLTIKKRLAVKTVDTYRIRFVVINRWLGERGLELNKFTFEKFLFELRGRGLSNAALNTYIQTLHHLDNFCRDRGLQAGFTDGIESMPKTHPEIVILSVDETERLVNTDLNYKNRNGVDCGDLNKKYRTLTNFLAITGCRFEEAASLQIKRIDIANGRATLVNTKNKDNRYIYFDGPIKQDLNDLIKGRKLDDLVFTNSRGSHVRPGEFNEDLRSRARKAGITKHVHAHLLRHSMATHLIIAGVDISMVATLLGHRDIKTTFETYVHLADETLKKAAMRSPLLSQHIEPQQIIMNMRDLISNLHLEKDARFNYQITEREGKLTFELSVR